MEKIASLGKVFDEEITIGMNEMGMEWRDDVRNNIHRVSGDLARSTNFEGTEKHGSEFVATVSNNLDYAEHYEYGHRQQPGRFVPVLGKRLKKSYVKGQYTFRKGRQAAKAKMPKIIREAISRAEARLSD
ncbi:MAG: HK97 gp10 family phage protein [Tissierellia bacterium]|nr:HK97 gp10 family phage protein [Tissierellia bacterium]